MVDLRGQYLAIQDEIDAAIQEVLTTTQFIKGPFVGKFECDLAGYLEGPYALGVGNGTDALQVALMALDVGPGDEVITSAFTFIATAEAAALLGAKAVFADIDPQTFNLDPARIERLITPQTKVIVPVHLFGQAADMDPILDVARRHDLRVVEDNAQAIGARYKGKRVGFLGDAGCLSFFPSKNLGAYGDGGAVLTGRRRALRADEDHRQPRLAAEVLQRGRRRQQPAGRAAGRRPPRQAPPPRPLRRGPPRRRRPLRRALRKRRGAHDAPTAPRTPTTSSTSTPSA